MSAETIVPNTDPNALLRLETAARAAFPDGSIKANGLRREAAAGHLVIYRIAGKDFTTLADIEGMKKQCRVQAKGRTSTTTSSGGCCTSATDNSNVAIASMKMTARTLKERLQNTSIKKHDPQKALNKDHPNRTKIADVLALEMKRIAATAMPDHRKRELITVCENMGDWFGGREIGDLDGELQERYAAERKRYVMKKINGKRVVVKTDDPAPIAAYRDLKLLAAAINRFFKKKVGGVWTRFSPVLPEGPEVRRALAFAR